MLLSVAFIFAQLLPITVWLVVQRFSYNFILKCVVQCHFSAVWSTHPVLSRRRLIPVAAFFHCHFDMRYVVMVKSLCKILCWMLMEHRVGGTKSWKVGKKKLGKGKKRSVTWWVLFYRRSDKWSRLFPRVFHSLVLPSAYISPLCFPSSSWIIPIVAQFRCWWRIRDGHNCSVRETHDYASYYCGSASREHCITDDSLKLRPKYHRTSWNPNGASDSDRGACAEPIFSGERIHFVADTYWRSDDSLP